MTYQELIDEWNDDARTVHVQTSGSTDVPKKMNVRKDRMTESAKMTCDFLGLQPGDTVLLCMNLDYIGAKMMVVRSLVRQLRLIQIAPSGHPSATVGVPIAFTAMVPLQAYDSLQAPKGREELRQTKHPIIGGGAIDDVLAAQLHDFPHAVWSTYGMIETLPHIALHRLNGLESSSWYTPPQGIRVSTNADECLVTDAPKLCDSSIVTDDMTEIRKTSTSEEQDALAFRIIGRRGNVIGSGGVKIQMEELERLIRPSLTMPYMVTKRKGEKFGEIVVLMVGKEDDDEGITFEERSELPFLRAIHKLLHRVLPRHWEPRLYLSADRIPMTETGKPNRASTQRIAENPDLPYSCVLAVDDG